MDSHRNHERIIVVTEIEAFGGAERSVAALLDRLATRAIPHRLVVYHDHIDMARHTVHVPNITVLAPKKSPVFKIKALRDFFAGRPAHGPKPLMSGFQSALHASAAGLSGFHTLMHDTPSLFGSAGRPATLRARARRRAAHYVLGRGLRRGGRTIVASDYLMAESRRLYNSDVAIARPGGLAPAGGFHPRVVEGEFLMLSVCRLEENKRIDWILRALAHLETGGDVLSKRIGWRLDVAGHGSHLEHLRALALRLGISDRVRFHGFVDDATLDAMFARSHLFLMPAVQGYGLPALEALYRGIPVLLHRDSGVSDILLDTPWCVVTEGGEAELAPALKRSIETVLAGAHLKAHLPRMPTQADWADQVIGLCGW